MRQIWGRRWRSLRRYLEILEPRDLLVYGWLRARRGSGARPRAIRVRSLGGAVVTCRATVADVFTFKAALLHEFHLPPEPLAENATILDFGSNIGLTVAHLAHTFPTARVFGVEMDADNIALARRNTAAFGDRVRVLHAAVWTKDGWIAYRGDRADGFQVAGEAAGPRQHAARAMRIDTIMDQCGIETADYVKMDIEGAESDVLAGDTGWLDRVRSIKVEVHPPATMESVAGALAARGFRTWPDAAHGRCVCAVRSGPAIA